MDDEWGRLHELVLGVRHVCFGTTVHFIFLRGHEGEVVQHSCHSCHLALCLQGG